MSFIILGYIPLVVACAIFYIRLNSYQQAAENEIVELKTKLDDTLGKYATLQSQIIKDSKVDSGKIEFLLVEIEGLRKEKEEEVRLRLEAEKQIENALQKAGEIEKRMSDWKSLQDAIARDYKDEVARMNNELFKKVQEVYKMESESNKNFISAALRNIGDYLGSSNELQADDIKAFVDHDTGSTLTKHLLDELAQILQENGHTGGKDYFLPMHLAPQKSKLMLCEMFFVINQRLYIIDLKGYHYFEDYLQQKSRNNAEATQNLKSKLNYYIPYIGNLKYQESILKLVNNLHVKFKQVSVVFVVLEAAHIEIIEEMGYAPMIGEHNNLEVLTIDQISHLIYNHES